MMTPKWVAVLLVSLTVLSPCLSQEAEPKDNGCFRDTGERDLPHLASADAVNTIQKCIAACQTLGFKYAGVQFSTHCFCGNSFARFGKADNCNMKCSGNSEQICGGVWASNIYTVPGYVEPVPEGPHEHYGCFKDTGIHDLPHLAVLPPTGNSIEQCKATCQKLGFKYAGVQYSVFCLCGNSFARYGKADNCNMKCNGNSEQICGGVWANNVYAVPGYVEPVPEGPLEHYGCFRDTGIRDLPHLAFISAINTIQMCKENCDRLGFKYAGVQFTSHCYCGNTFARFGKANNCDMKCNGNNEQTCGGVWANNVYTASGYVPPVPVGSLGHYGCFRDTGERDLPHLAFISAVNTIQLCKETCDRLRYKYAGLQFSTHCYCGNSLDKHGKADNCNMKCSGNTEQTCGGVWANDIYTASGYVPPVPVGRLGYLGCFRDTGDRDLPHLASISATNTIENCKAACDKLRYKYAGVQFSTYCYCGNSLDKHGKADNCNMKCSGNTEQICGGVWANDIYTAATVTVEPEPEGPLDYYGCFKDTGDRDLGRLAYAGDNSIEKCKYNCQKLEFKYAGVQYSTHCFCGNSFGKHGKAANCDMKCSGNKEQICGGVWASNIYRAGGVSLVVPQGPLGNLGCFKDAGDRDLGRLAYSAVDDNSIEKCKDTCNKQGFKYAGVQYSSQCFCGNSFGKHGKADNCDMKCSGNKEQICGGDWANNIYVAGDESTAAGGSSSVEDAESGIYEFEDRR